jgi:ATP-binding cassette subfamily B protein
MFGGGGGWWSYLQHDDSDTKPAVSRAVLRRVAGYARPYTGRIALMLASILVVTAMPLVPPLLMRELIDVALPNRDVGMLNLLAIGMVVVPILGGLVGVGQRYLGSQIGEGVICDLRRALFDHLQRQSLRFFTNSKSGELMARVNNDVVGAQRAINGTIVDVVSNTISLVCVLAIMIALEWRLALISVAVLPLFILPAKRIGRVFRRVMREQMTLNAKMNGMMGETLNISGALLVKLFGRADDESRKFGERATAVRDVGIRTALIGRWFFMGLGLVSAMGVAIVFWAGGHLVLSDQLTLGTVVAFGAYLGQLYGPLSSLTNARVELATSLLSFERVFEVLDLPVEIREAPHALALTNPRGAIEFDGVWFAYDALPEDGVVAGLRSVNRFRFGETELEDERWATRGSVNGVERWALADVSFVARPGQLVALVGPSGAGKTTLTYLLPRLYDPTQGTVRIDGHDLRDLRLDSLVDQIGMVTQETFLFHDTVRANLTFARPGATDSLIEEACRLANIHDVIMAMPDGYDTVVGERGYRLSGGEKQRIAIARVLLKDPRILVLDEATSHLDSESEALVQAALDRARAGRTSLVIAHRLSTILAADLILVMDGGRLVERGTHSELMGQDGLYARLFRTQFRAAAPVVVAV